MAKSASWLTTSTATVIGALIGAAATVLVAVITRPPTPTVVTSSKELVAILDARSQKVHELMALQEDSTLALLRAKGDTAAEARFHETARRARTAFQELQQRHRQALLDGRLVEAHEILRDIHWLLIAWSGRADIALYPMTSTGLPALFYAGAGLELAMVYPGDRVSFVGPDSSAVVGSLWGRAAVDRDSLLTRLTRIDAMLGDGGPPH